uniref:Uncharacterized protein n=1 Tax=viral metagenome TaxID=1070528 RepID=A0A6H1ZC32_9ZZZZ
MAVLVYCVNCRHCKSDEGSGAFWKCRASGSKINFVNGTTEEYTMYCETKNKRGDCQDFEEVKDEMVNI